MKHIHWICAVAGLGLGESLQEQPLELERVAGPAAGGAVLDLGRAGMFDQHWVTCPSVLKIGEEYRMWYAARSPNHGHSICTARSDDGLHFRRETAGQPVKGLRAEAFGPAIVRRGDRYLMLYMALKATRGLYAATSTDGANWTPANEGQPVMLPADADAFDSHILGHPALMVDGNRLRVWYTGYQRNPQGHDNLTMRIGLAESP
jgi:predicted GH43/DUF377 family glycosyl hydrolase